MERRNHRLTPQQISEMKELRNSGVSRQEIALRFSVCEDIVSKHTALCRKPIKPKVERYSDVLDYSIHGMPFFY